MKTASQIYQRNRRSPIKSTVTVPSYPRQWNRPVQYRTALRHLQFPRQPFLHPEQWIHGRRWLILEVLSASAHIIQNHSSAIPNQVEKITKDTKPESGPINVDLQRQPSLHAAQERQSVGGIAPGGLNIANNICLASFTSVPVLVRSYRSMTNLSMACKHCSGTYQGQKLDSAEHLSALAGHSILTELFSLPNKCGHCVIPVNAWKRGVQLTFLSQEQLPYHMQPDTGGSSPHRNQPRVQCVQAMSDKS